MDSEQERLRAEAETSRQLHELQRQGNERTRGIAEASRAAAEEMRRASTIEIVGTVDTLSTIVKRMEAVEALRREARRNPDKQDT